MISCGCSAGNDFGNVIGSITSCSIGSLVVVQLFQLLHQSNATICTELHSETLVLHC